MGLPMLRARFAPIVAARTAALALTAACLLPVGAAATTTVLADGPVPAATQPAPGTAATTGTGDPDMGWQ
ncbi:hypothetical protein GTW69_31895 [Streptomyces sp. SID7760]|nr:hypothetical protein [Streptomyces sp. SID7760]